MQHELVPVIPYLEKLARTTGPGRHELVRNFFVQARLSPIYYLTDSYGKVWIRSKDLEKVQGLVLPNL